MLSRIYYKENKALRDSLTSMEEDQRTEIEDLQEIRTGNSKNEQIY
jgi:hypothetical protein